MKWTYAEYCKLPDDGNRYEILDGVLYVDGAPETKPQRVLRKFFTALDLYADANNAYVGRTIHPLVIRVKIDDTRDIFLEVLSGGDQIRLLKEHEEFDAREYWIADPVGEFVRIVHLNDEKFERTIVEGNITSPLLPGFSLALKELFV